MVWFKEVEACRLFAFLAKFSAHYVVKYKQRARTIMSQFGFAQRGPADGSLLNGLRSAWNSGVRVVANTAAPFVHRRTTYCGASGGASALLALDVLTALERLPNQPLAVWVLSTPSLLSAFSMVYGEWTSYNSQGKCKVKRCRPQVVFDTYP